MDSSPYDKAMGDFGNKFRKAREGKKLSLDDISKVTKIGTRMLKAIEEEHFEQLPGGVFNKGFIRTYAKHLGMDDEEAVAEYLACQQQSQVEAAPPSELAHPGRPAVTGKLRAVESEKASAKSRGAVEGEELPDLHLPRIEDVRPSRRFSYSGGFPWKWTAFAVAVMVAGVFSWTRHSRAAHSDSVHAASPMSAINAVTPAAVPTSPKSASNQTTAAVATTPTIRLSPKLALQTPQPGTRPSAVAAVAAADTSPKGENATRSAATASNLVPSNQQSPSLALVIRATENSWISVVADGQPGIQETLIAPARTTVYANNEITVRVGNAAGVTFVWNGQEIPADGAEAEVKTFTFDASGLRAPTPAPSTARIP